MRPGAERIAGLDVLRGFAAAAVMLHHHGQYYDVLYPGRIPLSVDLGPGHFGVELFFIISGFVILMTIERKKTVREFAISRAARLMPAFLAALVMATVIRILSPVPFLDTPTLPQFLANLTMAPSLFGQTAMDMPYWTLTYELVFYIGMGLILALGMLRWTEWFGLLAVAVSCLFIATLDVRLHHRSSIVLLVYYSNFFLIGICLYRIHARTTRPVTWAGAGRGDCRDGAGRRREVIRHARPPLPAAHHRLHGPRLVRHQPAWQVARLAAARLPGTRYPIRSISFTSCWASRSSAGAWRTAGARSRASSPPASSP